MSDIGEGSEALVWVTDHKQCCQIFQQGAGTIQTMQECQSLVQNLTSIEPEALKLFVSTEGTVPSLQLESISVRISDASGTFQIPI